MNNFDTEKIKDLVSKKKEKELTSFAVQVAEIVKNSLDKERPMEVDLKGFNITAIKGKDGYSPIKGEDYFTQEEITNFLKSVSPEKGKDYFTKEEIVNFLTKATPIKGKDYFDGENGKNGKTPVFGLDYFTKAQAKRFLELATPEKGLDYFDGKRGEQGKDGKDGKDGKAPEHEWKDTSLRFKNPDGTWGKFVDLVGKIRLLGGAITYFKQLVDVPQSYNGQKGKVLVVKNSEDGLEYVSMSAAQGNVSSVNGKQGDVVLTTADISDSTDKLYMTEAEHSNLVNQTGVNTGDQVLPTDATLSTSDIATNNASTSKHGFFPKLPTAVGKFLRDDMSWQTITTGIGDMLKSVYDPTNKNADAFSMDNMVEGSVTKILTAAERTKLSNTSGTNTGDQTLPTDATLVFTDVTTNNASTSKHGFVPKLPSPTGKFLKDDLSWAAISGGGDMLKSTYDPGNKGVDAFSMDNMVEGSSTKILTSTERTKLTNTTNTNSGDETLTTIKDKLGITTLSGSNTGDQDLSVLVTKTTTVNGHALSGNVSVIIGDLAVTSQNVGNSTNPDTFLTNVDDSLTSMAQTGFGAWTSGSDASTYTLTGGKFQIDRTGYGYINGKKISWSSGQQTASLGANTLSWIYIDATGTLVADTTHPSGKIYLFEVLYDGTNYLVAKENHSYNFNTGASSYLHNNAGTVVRGIGAIATRKAAGTGASTDDRQIKIVGADNLDDHGLTTTIADSAGAGVTWNTFYKNGAGKWIRYASQLELPIYYDNAGTPTALDVAVNVYAVYTLYVAKDDIEGTDNFIAVMPDAAYTTLGGVLAAITAGTNTFSTNELKSLEAAQLGYAIVQYSATGGYINQITIAKSTFNNQLVGGAAGGSHNLLSNLDYASAGHTGFQPTMIVATTVTDETGFGVSKVVGTATSYAREDHSHGSAGHDSHTALSNIGTNTHAQVDTALTRLANTSGTNTGDQTLPVGGTPAIVLGTVNTAGASPNFLRRDDTILAFDATNPSTQAYGDSAVVGVATVAARRDHKHAMPAIASDATTTFTDITTNNASTSSHGFVVKATAPAANILNVVGIANGETVYTNKSIFDATSPTTQAFGDAAVAGTSLIAAHRDHKHAMPAAEKDTTAITGILKGNGSVISVASAGSDYSVPAGTETLTNKRITARESMNTTSATPTPAGDSFDCYTLTALASGATFGAPTGTPTDFQKMIIRIRDNGGAQTLAWNAIYQDSSDLALPTTTTAGKTLWLGFIYNSDATKWQLISKLDNFS